MRYILARLVACLTVSRHLSGVGFAIESMIVKKKRTGRCLSLWLAGRTVGTVALIASSYRFSAFAHLHCAV